MWADIGFISFVQMVGKAADFRVMRGVVPTSNQLAFGILPMEAIFFSQQVAVQFAFAFNALNQTSI